MLRYGTGNGWLEGRPAAVTRGVGHGSITYVGANLDAALMKIVIGQLAKASGVEPVLPELPAELDVAVREGSKKKILIVTNYGQGELRIPLGATFRNVLQGEMVREITLPRYGVALLEGPPAPIP